MLHDPARHEPLRAMPWDEARARATIAVFLLQLSVFAITHAIVQRVVALWKQQLTQRSAVTRSGHGAWS